jgi:hypothetical protein
MVNSWDGCTPYQAILAAGSSILPTHLAPFDTAVIDKGSATLQLDLEFNGPIRWHPG